MAEAGHVEISRGAIVARFSVRGDMAVVRAIGAAVGVSFPERINRGNGTQDRAALKLGPDEWLLLAQDASAETLYPLMQAAPVGQPASIVDVSHRQVAILVIGAGCTDVLNAAVPLDLSLAAFPVGMATRTIFDKAEIVLWRKGEHAFHLEVWRSFAAYVEALLAQFVRESVPL